MNTANKVYTVEELKEKLAPIFLDAPVYKATLFGSYAKGEADSDSDVDIVIDSKGHLINIHFFGIIADVEDALGKTVDLLEISQIKPNSEILHAIRNEGIVLYERQ